MTTIFLKLLNMSIAASWLVLAVVLLRPLLKKAPKWISCLLWGIVALRLMVPVAPESDFSLIPSAEVIPQDIIQLETPEIHSAIPVINDAVNPLFTGYLTPEKGILEKGVSFASAVWAAGKTVARILQSTALLPHKHLNFIKKRVLMPLLLQSAMHTVIISRLPSFDLIFLKKPQILLKLRLCFTAERVFFPRISKNV